MLKVYFTNRFYLLLAIFCLSFFAVELNFNAIIVVNIIGAVILIGLILDFLSLFSSKNPIHVWRHINQNLSLGDEEKVTYTIKNNLKIPLNFELYDAYPKEFGKREFKIVSSLKGGNQHKFKEEFTPKIRGEFHFKWIDVYLHTAFNLIQRRVSIDAPAIVKVYPSVVQLKKFSIANIKNSVLFHGVKKVRKVGHSYDFDHIKQYVVGDDIRSINWKASSRKSELMVNHYEDEKSQSVYCIIDKSRVMNMTFNQLSLLDYAINASLVISNAALQHQDKAGLITFSDVLGNIIPAARNKNQLMLINESLYNQNHRETEANYPLLFYSFNKLSRKRSLLFLFTNFESLGALEAQLGSMMALSKNHVLVVIVFRNTDAENYYNDKIDNKARLFEQGVAERYFYEKQKIIQRIRSLGIRCVYTYPNELTVNTLNEYLLIKSSGVI